MNIIEIKNLNFKYGNKIIFDNLNLSIKKNSFVTVLGANGSGKSTLAQLIYKNHQNILVREQSVCYLPSNPNDYIVGKTVEEQLFFHLKMQNIPDSQIERRISKIVKIFDLNSMLIKDPFQLSIDERQLIVLLSNVIANFKIIILDDALSLIKPGLKFKLFKYIKARKRTIINFTNDTEESIYSDYIAILNKDIILNKPTLDAFLDEKKFIDNSLKLPFLAELSLKLRYYDLVDEIVLDMDKMVNKLWS